MKILWLVNTIMPDLAVHFGGKPSVFGGWLTGAMKAVREDGHEMVVCAVENSGKRAGRYEANGAVYYILQNADDKTLEKSFGEILDNEKPDIVHVYGTEFAYIMPLLNTADPERTVLTLQGSMQCTRDCAYAGISESVCKDTAWHKLRRKLGKGGYSIELMKNNYTERAVIEENIFRKIKYADGCSDWGIAYIKSMNPDCCMFNCGCLLRSNFYGDPKWNEIDCEKHSILALMTRPAKGAHILIEAMPYILKQYPDAKLYLAGTEFTYRNYSGIKRSIQNLTPDYNWYVQNQIEKFNLKDNIVFLGYLDAEQMKQQMLKANVFVSPSANEHLATALGEAMLTGTPSISTSVGALCEMIDHRKDGYLYDFSETHVLAQYICDIFDDRTLAERFSKLGRAHAERTYNAERNSKALLDMYYAIDKMAKEKAE